MLRYWYSFVFGVLILATAQLGLSGCASSDKQSTPPPAERVDTPAAGTGPAFLQRAAPENGFDAVAAGGLAGGRGDLPVPDPEVELPVLRRRAAPWWRRSGLLGGSG